jgi:multidrug transporter EmrE-like cation transporter
MIIKHVELGNNKKSILIAFILALTGAISLVIIKKINHNEASKYWLIIPILINILSIFLILIGLKYSSITIFNIQWNLISNILVTGIGVLFLNEIHSIYEIIGLVLAFISIFILNIEHIK